MYVPFPLSECVCVCHTTARCQQSTERRCSERRAQKQQLPQPQQQKQKHQWYSSAPNKQLYLRIQCNQYFSVFHGESRRFMSISCWTIWREFLYRIFCPFEFDKAKTFWRRRRKVTTTWAIWVNRSAIDFARFMKICWTFIFSSNLYQERTTTVTVKTVNILPVHFHNLFFFLFHYILWIKYSKCIW